MDLDIDFNDLLNRDSKTLPPTASQQPSRYHSGSIRSESSIASEESSQTNHYALSRDPSVKVRLLKFVIDRKCPRNFFVSSIDLHQHVKLLSLMALILTLDFLRLTVIELNLCGPASFMFDGALLFYLMKLSRYNTVKF